MLKSEFLEQNSVEKFERMVGKNTQKNHVERKRPHTQSDGRSMTLPIWKLIKDMLGRIDLTDMDYGKVKKFKCPECGETFDVEKVREMTDNGEFPICMECGEVLQAKDGD